MFKEISASFNLLDNRVQKWIWKQGWEKLNDIQESAIPIILQKDCDVIISAATAGGKTEAAFLPIISSILNSQIFNGYSVLYISPLKALINDQYRRINDMLTDLPIDLTPWHGDIDANKKNRSLKHPNGILMITPESLESFFINRQQNLEFSFRNLSYIVIDELHSFIGSERGKQLQSLLSRVEKISKKTIPRIALSATFSDFETVKFYLRNDQSFQCSILATGISNHETQISIKYFEDIKAHSPEKEIAIDIFNKLRGENNLVFANSRSDVEKYASILSDISEKNHVPNEFKVHHGSLSKNEREVVEQELQKGKYPISAVCTSTLELGIDIGTVNSIVQIGVANSVSGLRQRLGRSGRRDKASILRIYSIDNERNLLNYLLKIKLVQNIAVIELLKEKKFEKPSTASFHFSTFIQQLLSVLSQHGGFQAKDGWLYLCQKGAFNNISPKLYKELLMCLGEKQIISQTQNGVIIIGFEGEKILNTQSFYVAFQTTVDYTLINNETNKSLGCLDYLPNVGMCVIFGGRKWNVISTNGANKKIYVTQVRHGVIPFFNSEPGEIDRIIVQKMKSIYQSNVELNYLDSPAKNAFEECKTFFKKANFNNSNYFNDSEENILLTWAGMKINRTISLMLERLDGLQRGFSPIFIVNVTSDQISELRKTQKPIGLELSALILKREFKEFQKYDYLLTEKLLDLEYAKSKLDIKGAWSLFDDLQKN